MAQSSGFNWTEAKKLPAFARESLNILIWAESFVRGEYYFKTTLHHNKTSIYLIISALEYIHAPEGHEAVAATFRIQRMGMCMLVAHLSRCSKARSLGWDRPTERRPTFSGETKRRRQKRISFVQRSLDVVYQACKMAKVLRPAVGA